MGFGGISIWQLVIILGIIVLLFGTKKLRNLGGDLGSAVKGFKKAMNDENSQADDTTQKKSISQEDADTVEPKQQDAANAEQKSDNK